MGSAFNCAARVMLRGRAMSSRPVSAVASSVAPPPAAAAAAAAAARVVAPVTRSIAGGRRMNPPVKATFTRPSPVASGPTSSSLTVRLHGRVGGARRTQRLASGRAFTASVSSADAGATGDDGEGRGDNLRGAVDTIRIVRLEGADVGALSDVLLSLGATCCSVEDADLGTEDEVELYAVGKG